VNEKKDILVVPGKAIRFTPDQETYSAYLKSLPQDSTRNRGLIMPKKGEKERSFIWTKNGQVIRKNEVKTGANDGINYELISGLHEGDEIVLSMTIQKGADAKKAVARSPFMPQRPGQRK
jgi:HlyD family secretion protein